MVKFNFWDRFFGSRPKSFRREAEKQIKKNTLYYIKNYGKSRWINIEELFEKTLEKTDLFNSEKGKMLFAVQGIKSKIHSATHKLRREGHPIISGTSGKGYRYADENSEDFIFHWMDKINGWEKRKTNLKKEFLNDKDIIEKMIARLEAKKRVEEAKKLKKVLVVYEKRAKKIKDET